MCISSQYQITGNKMRDKTISVKTALGTEQNKQQQQTTATNMGVHTSIISAHRRETHREGGGTGPRETEEEREGGSGRDPG